MPKYDTFEDLPVWQEAALLYNQVLDLMQRHAALFTAGFRNQLDRAALSVSNNIAEGFERVTSRELVSFLAIARGSAGEVRSMIAVVKNRPELKPLVSQLEELRALAKACARQLTAWTASIEDSPVQGKRHLTGEVRQRRERTKLAERYRLDFLRNLKPDHPLYHSSEARAARGEPGGG